MRTRIGLLAVAAVALLIAPLLGACGATPAPTSASTQAPAAASTTAPPTQPPPPTATKAPPTATPVPPTATPKGPTVGGKFVFALPAEIDTLDPAVSVNAWAMLVTEWVGGTMLTLDPKGKVVGYLVETWKVSPDAKVFDFTLRKGIKFHDGTPLKASDYVYTFKRRIDPATKSPQAGDLAVTLANIEALDDYTFRLTFKVPKPDLIETISFGSGSNSPLSEAYMATVQGTYGRKPMGVGPFKFVEWQTGNKVVLQRNPDFAWGPDFWHKGAFWVDTVEVRFLPEAATIVGGLESGEIDYALSSAINLPRFQGKAGYQIFEKVNTGILPYIAMNLNLEPFKDLRVRKAMNLAVDRQTLIKVAVLGAAIEQRGPLTPTTLGYWPDSEKVGLGFDLAQAKQLMKEAGYAAGADGVLEKDGKPLRFKLNWLPGAKDPEVLQQQWKALGVDVQIQNMEAGVLIGSLFSFKYEMSWIGYASPNATILNSMFNTKYTAPKGANVHPVSNPELDTLLNALEVEVDAAKRTEGYYQVQKFVIENAYIIPLYASKAFGVLNARWKGAVGAPYCATGFPFFSEMYLETK